MDTSRLEAGRAREIEQLAEQVMDSTDGGEGPVGADLMRYEITIEQGNRKRSLTWVDDGSAEQSPLKRLIEAVLGEGLA